jgi:hypothetical protein
MTPQTRPKTLARQVRFLVEFSRAPSVSRAAARAGLPRGTIYMWRHVNDEFRAAFDRIASEHTRRRDVKRITRCPTRLPVLPDDLPVRSITWAASP